MRMYTPPHPGVFLKEEVVEPLNLTVTTASKILGVTRPALSKLLNGRASLSPEMALRFENGFGLKYGYLDRIKPNLEMA